MKRIYLGDDVNYFIHGADYNPEQWIGYDGIWEKDIELMKEANCNEMTVGVFSWSRLEPKEGVYDFSFLDAAIDRVHKAGGKIVLATPSGARTHWMADKYPEILRCNDNGERMMFGFRHNHCFTSPVYREKVRQINMKLSERYGNHPAVLAWHISNEYGGKCFCPLCRAAFREFLKKRYDNDIEKLNAAYWSTFWSLRFDSFDQIDPPMARGLHSISALSIDWRRFISYQTKDFMKAEIAAVKEFSDKPITINMMGDFYDLNYTEFADDIDIASWDSYPDWHKDGNLDSHLAETRRAAYWHDFFRSLKQKPFMLMESAPGLINWSDVNKLKRPGMDRLASIQAVAHGSDSVQYFQFRKSRGNCEKYHGAIVDHRGTSETRVFQAVKSTGKTLKDIAEVAGTMPDSKVAIIYDWESRWALELSAGFIRGKKDYSAYSYEYYRYFWDRGISVDIVGPHADLSKYKLVVAPLLYMVDESTINNISSYVENGGNFYATYLLGMVNETDLCYLGGFPGGKLKEVFGIWNEEIDCIYSKEFSHVKCSCGKEYKGTDYCELIHAEGSEVLAEYASDFYSGRPALTKNSYGKGVAYYQAFHDIGDFKDDVFDKLVKELSIPRALDVELPKGVTAHTRGDDEDTYLFLENYSGEKFDGFALDGRYLDLESRKECYKVDLSEFDVRILKKLS